MKRSLTDRDLPFHLSWGIKAETYNAFIESQEISGYKFLYEHGSVYIVEMPTDEHEIVVDHIKGYFRIPTALVPPPIFVAGAISKGILSVCSAFSLWLVIGLCYFHILS